MKQNLQKQIIMTLLAALALFGTGLSCGGGEKADVTLQMWKRFDSTDKWQDIISAYGEYRAGVKIVYTQKPADTYERDLLDAMAAGKGPDIFSLQNGSLPRFRDKISPTPADIMPLRSYLDTFVKVAADNFVEGTNIYAIPSAMDVLALFYNRQHLASAGL